MARATLYGAVAQVAVLDSPSYSAALYGAVAQVAVLDSPSYSAALYGAVAQVAVLDSPSYSAALYGAVAQVAVLDSPSYSAALYGTVGQVAVIPPSPVAVLPDISGAPTVLATFDGSGSQFHHYYAWEWTSLPGGSAISNYPIALPDNGATSMMVDNELLCHFEGNANDTSGNSRNGAVSGATQVTGKVGLNAYSFDGSNDYIDYGSILAFTTGDFTFSFWMNPDASQGSWVKVFSNRVGTTGEGYNLERYGTNTYRFQSGDGSSWYANNNTMTIPAGVWSHITLVRVGTAITGYLDGAAVYTDVAPATIAGTDDFILGAKAAGDTTYAWDGLLDEFAVWSRALSPTEIGDIYDQQSKTGLGVSTATAAFTPDIAGTYTVQLTVADGVSVTADAVIVVPGGGGRRKRRRARRGGRGFFIVDVNASGQGFGSAFD